MTARGGCRFREEVRGREAVDDGIDARKEKENKTKNIISSRRLIKYRVQDQSLSLWLFSFVARLS
jgi:hypothetical protein